MEPGGKYFAALDLVLFNQSVISLGTAELPAGDSQKVAVST